MKSGSSMKQSERTFGLGKKYFFASNGEHEDIDLEIGMKLENSVDYEKKLQENAIFRKYY